MNNFTFKRVAFCCSLLFLLLCSSLKAQQTLTQITGWNAYVHLPANYSSTSTTYPTIIFFPGIGEVGTNASALISNGPGAYITQGWNGNVVVDGNTVEFIVISLQPPSGYPGEYTINQKIQTIKSLYRVNPNRLYLTGLSHGGWCATTFVTGDAYGGPYTYASQVAAVVEVEGVQPDDNAPYPNLFDNFALSGGKLLGFEQANDYRGISGRVARMNSTVPNSGIFISTNYGGGGHCCWSQFYGGGGTQPGVYSLGGVNQNLYQWLARQSLGGPPPPANQVPTANAGSDIAITLPTNTATLTGSGTDLDGTITGYAWTKVSGGAAVITSPASASTTITGLAAGVYQFQLTVTDNGGASSTDLINVTVNAAANQTPTANAGSDIAITLPTNIATLTGSGTDLDGTITGYAWTKVSGGAAVITSPASASTTITGLAAGVYQFRLTVTDNGGATSTDLVNITVNAAANQTPTANAGSDITLTLPTNSATLSGSGTDLDGTITGYAWTKVSGGAATITSPTSASTTITGLVAGAYQFQLTVTDNGGASSTDLINVTVNAAANQTPTANAGSDITLTLPTNSATLSGSGTDLDGTITEYAWTKVSGGTATITSPTSASTTITGLLAGAYQFQLTVTDNSGATATDLINITVNALVNSVPVVNAGGAQAITLPINSITLSGTASDADGTISSTLWTKLSGPASGTITSPNALTTTITGLTQGVYIFQLRVTDNLGAITNDIATITVNAFIAAAGCNANAPVTYTIAPTSPGEIYITNASARPWKGGDTLKIPAGTYSVIEIDSFGGDPCRDIIIINSGGLVNVTGSMRFKNNVHHVKITGSGAAGLTYGFKCIAFGFNRVNHYTMERIECGPNPGGVGIYGKQDPYVGQPWTQYPNYTSTKITINNCYVHDVAGEGMYIGHTAPSGDPYNSNLIPQRLDSVTISNCTVNNTGWDGIQLSNARNGCNIFGNTITNFGLVDYDGQRSGIISGGNTSSNVYNNTITNGTGNGIQFFGYGIMQCYNNTITNVGSTNKVANGEESIYGQAYTNGVEANPKQAMIIHDNQINYPRPHGAIRFWDWANSEPPNIYNNKFCFATPPAANWQITHLAVQPGFINVNNILSCTAGPNLIPTANAGSDITITLPTNTATLSGSGTDADGTITGYLWIKLSGPASGTLTNTTAATATASGLVAGVYIYQLTVTDNNGATSSDLVTVTVNTLVNQAPVADAGPNQNITLPTNTVTLNGIGTDADGTIAAYNWTKLSGPTATITTAGSATTTVTGLVTGTYQFQLRVTDNSGATATDIITITVNAAVNQAPIADAGINQVITLPTSTVTFNGSATDADGTIVTYSWTKLSGPAATITTTGSATTTVTGLVAGTYQFQLSVTDNGGATATDIVTVTVNTASNQAPLADAGINQAITLPLNTITLNGSGTDADGTIVTYNWTKLSGPAATITTAGSATTTVTGLVAGTYQFQLSVTDNGGATSTDIVTVTVNAAAPLNQAPIANAGTGINITLPTSTVTLNGSGTDADGTIATYSWTKLSGPAATITNAGSATTTVTGLVAGVYQLQLTVTDDDGATDADIVTVTVNPAVNLAPIANAGAGISITLPTNSVSLTGTGSDADGSVVTYNWTKVSGPAATITDASSPSTSITGLTAGTYSFMLTVTDDDGATGTDVVIVTVNSAVNQPPIAIAGVNINITLPTNTVMLNGAGIDPDGSISSYHWIKLSGSTATINSPSTASTSITDLVAGVYQFELEVTDNDGLTAVDIITVTVGAAVNQLPIANAGGNQSITIPVNYVTLNGSGSDVDGSIISYNWTILSGPGTPNISSANSATTSITGLNAGVYIVQFTVTDNNGATATDIITITVNSAPNAAPIANAGPDRIITLPASNIILDGSASTDPDGSIVSYSWTKISGPSPTTVLNVTSDKATILTVYAGTYEFELTVVDNSGTVSTDRVVITVNPDGSVVNKKPIANAGNDISISVPAVSSTILDGSKSSDPDGSIVSYSWKQIAGPSTATLLSPTSVSSTVSGLTGEGDYLYELTVTDNSGESAKDTVKITSVNTLRITQSIQLFPNPASDIMKIRFISDKTGKMTMRIFDVLGRFVQASDLEKSATMYEKSINVTTLTPGTYFLRLEFSDGNHIVQKFIKQ